MKPLPSKINEFIHREFVYGKYRFLGRPSYVLCMWGILFWERFLDIFAARDDASLAALTILIKTFERDKSVSKLVCSIKRKYPEAAVVVVNDSKEPKRLDGVHNLIMPYDSGVSAGRNAGLKMISTQYFLLLDDDFVFSRRQNLGALVAEMDKYPNIDILGGRCIDLPFFTIRNFQDTPFQELRLAPNVAPRAPIGTLLGENRVVDKVQNYFIGRTSQVRKVCWNEKMKAGGEHEDFFARAKGVLVTAYREDMLILHAKTPFDRAYLSQRFRVIQTA